MKRKRTSSDLDSFFEEFDFDWDALAEEANSDAVIDSFGTGLAAAISERDGRKLRAAMRMSSGTGRGLSEDLRNMLEEFDGWLAEEKSAGAVETKGLLSEVRMDIQDLLYDMERHNTAVPGNRAVTQALLDALVASEADDADGVRDAIDRAAQEAEDGGLSAGFVDAIRAALANVPPEGMDERSAGAVEMKGMYGPWAVGVHSDAFATDDQRRMFRQVSAAVRGYEAQRGDGYPGFALYYFESEEDANAFADEVREIENVGDVLVWANEDEEKTMSRRALATKDDDGGTVIIVTVRTRGMRVMEDRAFEFAEEFGGEKHSATQDTIQFVFTSENDAAEFEDACAGAYLNTQREKSMSRRAFATKGATTFGVYVRWRPDDVDIDDIKALVREHSGRTSQVNELAGESYGEAWFTFREEEDADAFVAEAGEMDGVTEAAPDDDRKSMIRRALSTKRSRESGTRYFVELSEPASPELVKALYEEYGGEGSADKQAKRGELHLDVDIDVSEDDDPGEPEKILEWLREGLSKFPEVESVEIGEWGTDKSIGETMKSLFTKSFDLTADQVYELSDDVLEPLSRALDTSLPDAVGNYRADVSNAADEMSLLSQGLPEDVDGSALVSAAAELTAASRDLLAAMPMGDFADSIVEDFPDLPEAINALGSALDSAISAVEALDRDLQVSVDDVYTQEDPQDDSRSVRQRVTLETSTEQVMGMLQALVGTWAQLQDVPAVFTQWQVEARDAVREAYEELDGVEKSMRTSRFSRKNGKTVGRAIDALRAKCCDYPSYAGMPFGSPTLSTRYVDVPASECAELSYSVREAGEALEAASEIYLQRAAAAARGEGDAGDEGDSAPDVAAMNTLNGVAVQLETLADRLLAVGDPGSAASGNGPYVTTEPGETPRCFYSWPDCLPSCLAAVEGALGSVTGDAEYLEVAAQLTVVRDMLRGLLEECEEEEELGELGELGETKAARGARVKGRLGRLSAVSDKVDYAVDALAGFSRGTPGVTDALRILKDMQAAIEDGDRDAFGEALDELGGVRDEVDGDLDEGETGEFPHELAWLLSDLTDAYYGNKSAAGVRTKYVDERFAEVKDLIQNVLTALEDSSDEDATDASDPLLSAFDAAADQDLEACADFVAEALTWSVIADDKGMVSDLKDAQVVLEEIKGGAKSPDWQDEPLRDEDGNYMGRSMRDTRTKKASRRSRFGDERSAMDTLAELSTQLDRVTDEAWTGRRRIVDSKARAALETAVAAASFVAESVGESISNKAPLSAEQLAEELGRASDALRVLEKSGDPWATTFRDDLSEFGSLLGRSASALDRYLDEAGEASGDEDGSPPGAKDESRGSKLRRRQLAARERGEAEILRKAARAARLAREVQGLERAINNPEAANDAAFARAVTAPQSALAARRASRVRAY